MTTETDRQLTKAAARNPELSAMLAGRHDDPSARYRRLATLVGGAAVAVGIVWGALAWLPGPRPAPARPHEPAQEIDTSHYLRPLETAAAGPGEQVAPFSGFAIAVETEPPGALVTIAGVPRGEAPALANVDCTPGAKLEIRAEKEGFAPARAETACRADTLVKLTVRLRQ
jgi:hypothetical protein